MRTRRLPLLLTALLAGAWVGGVQAQEAASRTQPTVVPVLSSNKLEGYLLLEPAATPPAGARWRFGNNTLEAAFGLRAGNSLALLCNRSLANAIGNLADYCVLGTVDGSGGGAGMLSLARGGTRLGLAGGNSRGTLPAWLTPGSGGTRAEVNDLTVFAEKPLSRDAYVSIAGTVARARLLGPDAALAPGLLPDSWNSRRISIGGGFRAFGINVIGQVIETPGQPDWRALGLGVTWRTPWSGQLSVGAENVVTRGRNPFATGQNGEDDGTVPYIRYEQDL